MAKKKTIQPKLRFKNEEGKDYPDWEVTTLGKISREVMYGLNSAAIPYDGVNKYIRITDIDESSRKFKPNPLTTPDGDIDNRYKVQEGDILFARTGASVGKSYVYNSKDGNLFFAGFLIKFSIKEANPYFVFAQTLTEDYNKWVLVNSMRSGQPGINAEEFKSLKILLPSIEEQNKIADFLMAIDDKIENLEKELEELKAYKKGVMQAIFAAASDATERRLKVEALQDTKKHGFFIRFKDENGNDYPNWVEKTLGEICSTFKSGEGITSKEIFEEGEFPVYGGNGLRGYTNTYTHDGFYVLIGRQGALCGNINRANGKSFISEHAIAVKANEDSDTEWLAQNLIYMNLNKYSESSAQPGLAVNKLIKLKIFTPSLNEQRKIAGFLSTLDDKVDTINQNILATKKYKISVLKSVLSIN